jgi:hypothetical protein
MLILTNLNTFHNLLQKNIEYCGNFNILDNKLVINNIIKGTSNSCKQDIYTKYIWHTHHNISKSYPSVQDIIKVMKHNNIYSIIFTKWGIWVLNCDTFYNINDIDIKLIDTLLGHIYFNTEKGRTNNIDFNIIDNFINNIQKYYNINIGLYSWYNNEIII